MSDLDATARPGASWITPLRLFLTALTAIGFIVPNAMVITYFASENASQANYFHAWTATLPSTQLLVDLSIVVVAFLGWALTEARKLRILPWWWLSAALTFLVGICCAVPLFLLIRDLRKDRMPGSVAV